MVAMSIALIIVGPPQYRCFELRLLPFAPSDRPAQSVGELALAHVGDRLADLRLSDPNSEFPKMDHLPNRRVGALATPPWRGRARPRPRVTSCRSRRVCGPAPAG